MSAPSLSTVPLKILYVKPGPTCRLHASIDSLALWETDALCLGVVKFLGAGKCRALGPNIYHAWPTLFMGYTFRMEN